LDLKFDPIISLLETNKKKQELLKILLTIYYLFFIKKLVFAIQLSKLIKNIDINKV